MKPLDPRLVQKLVAGLLAAIGCIASFKLLTADQAAAISTTIAAFAALWEPSKT